MLWARIEEGRCAEFTDRDPAGRYPDHDRWVQVPEAYARFVDLTWIVDAAGGPMPGDLAAFRQTLKDAVAERRYQAQVTGPLHNDLRYHADNQSVSVMETALAAARRYEAANGAGSFTTTWKARTGFAALTLPDLEAAANAVMLFVQRCFNREAEIALALDGLQDHAALFAAYSTMIAACWPGDDCEDGTVGATPPTLAPAAPAPDPEPEAA